MGGLYITTTRVIVSIVFSLLFSSPFFLLRFHALVRELDVLGLESMWNCIARNIGPNQIYVYGAKTTLELWIGGIFGLKSGIWEV